MIERNIRMHSRGHRPYHVGLQLSMLCMAPGCLRLLKLRFPLSIRILDGSMLGRTIQMINEPRASITLYSVNSLLALAENA